VEGRGIPDELIAEADEATCLQNHHSCFESHPCIQKIHGYNKSPTESESFLNSKSPIQVRPASPFYLQLKVELPRPFTELLISLER
jgi:hypothetical protein